MPIIFFYTVKFNTVKFLHGEIQPVATRSICYLRFTAKTNLCLQGRRASVLATAYHGFLSQSHTPIIYKDIYTLTRIEREEEGEEK